MCCNQNHTAMGPATHYHTRAWQTLIYRKACYIVIVIYIGLFGYCKGGIFNIHIWAWFGYFNCSRMEIRFYLLVKCLKIAWAAQACVHFMKALSVNALNPHLLTLKAYITTPSYVLSSIEILWSLLNKHCRSRAAAHLGAVWSWSTLFASIILLNNKQNTFEYSYNASFSDFTYV